MEKLKKMAIMVAVLWLVAISLVLLSPVYFRYLYNSNRIRGTIHVTVDGESYDLKEDDVTGSYENSDVGIEFSKKADDARVSLRGGDYGPYYLSVRIEGVPSLLTFAVYQGNWYNVTNFNVTVDIDSSSDKITIKSHASVLNEFIFFGSEEHSAEYDYSDRNIVHSIVSV